MQPCLYCFQIFYVSRNSHVAMLILFPVFLCFKEHLLVFRFLNCGVENNMNVRNSPCRQAYISNMQCFTEQPYRYANIVSNILCVKEQPCRHVYILSKFLCFKEQPCSPTCVLLAVLWFVWKTIGIYCTRSVKASSIF